MEHSTQHATEASVGVEPELTIDIRPYDDDEVCFKGSRAQLEAEGLVPVDLVWPVGRAAQTWERGGMTYCLHRVRPADMKGPMRQWIEGDYWHLIVKQAGVHRSYQEREADRARRDLEEAARRLNPAYQLAKAVLSDKWSRAYHDKAYQAFKGKIPGLIPPPRKRKSKQAEGV